jgi:peptidoglycan/LPS O-acetylase OafA/YrhL
MKRRSIRARGPMLPEPMQPEPMQPGPVQSKAAQPELVRSEMAQHGTMQPQPRQTKPPRLRFANQLRGVAALAVACSHLIGVFWVMRDFAALATATPVQAGPNPPLVALVSHPWFNLGPFGVGVFFLISGLVIPFSLQRHSRGSFLLARLLRIYPTYVAALLIEVAVVHANSTFWQRPFPYGAWTVLSNCLLIQDLVGQPSIDLVNWTLCVELRFYVVVALVAGAVRRGSMAALAGIAMAAAGLVAAAAAGAFGPPGPDPVLLSYAVSTESLFIVFMLIGVVFNFHLRGCIGTAALLGSVAALGGLFAACWRMSALSYQYPGVPLNYACALGLFGALYAVRSRIPANPVLDAMAAISFPFYLVHSLIGYSVLKLLVVVWQVGYPLALAGAVLAVVALATGLHLTVESSSVRWGHWLSLRSYQRAGPFAITKTSSRTLQ